MTIAEWYKFIRAIILLTFIGGAVLFFAVAILVGLGFAVFDWWSTPAIPGPETVAELTPLELYSVVLVAVLMGAVAPAFMWHFARTTWHEFSMIQKCWVCLACVFLYGLPAWFAFEVMAP